MPVTFAIAGEKLNTIASILDGKTDSEPLYGADSSKSKEEVTSTGGYQEVDL